MTAPVFNESPSQAKIFSTRPAEREATWTSSTSIVPETALFWRRQPVRRVSAQTEMANRKRMRSCATLCAGNNRKGNGWLLENATGPKAWHQAGDKSRGARWAGGVSQAAGAIARGRFVYRRGDCWRRVRSSLRHRATRPGNGTQTVAQAAERSRGPVGFVAEENLGGEQPHHRGR